MAKIYKIDSLKYTPFDENFIKEDFEYLKSRGIEITESKKDADIFVAYDSKKLKKFLLQNPFKRPLLLWTNEPRLSRAESSSYILFLQFAKIHVMNVYTGDVFINNFTYQEKRFLNTRPLPFLPINFVLKTKKVAALMSYYNGGKNSRIIIGGKNIDLVKKRSDIGIYGYENNKIEIYGRGWPQGVVQENSRAGNWTTRKSELLKNYHFNLCFENTVYPKYITEKIWDSIENYCLPIYYGGSSSSIYDLFPKDSFIDYADYEDPKRLFDYIDNMKSEEFVLRMNKCLEVYNSLAEKPLDFWKENKLVLLNKIVNKIKALTKEE